MIETENPTQRIYMDNKETGGHICSFRCFDTIGRLICCYCGALAYPEDKEGKYRFPQHCYK